MPVGAGDWPGEMLVWAMLLAGITGSILPLLPGAPLVLGGALLHKLLYPEMLSWWVIVVLAGAVGLSILLEWIGGMVGAKVFGAGRWGIGGALAGGIIGLFFGLPGLVIGPIAGAFLLEWLAARKPWPLAGKAAIGVIVGICGANLTHFLLSLGMVVLFVLDAYFW